jgi:hypothetical protein
MVYWEDNQGTLDKVAFYHMDLLNNFNNSAPHALSNTPLYSQNRDLWHNVRTIRHTELECGVRLCVAASMIAQYRGTIPNRVKSCREIDNLSIFVREYVVNVLTAKKWSGIKHQKGKT